MKFHSTSFRIKKNKLQLLNSIVKHIIKSIKHELPIPYIIVRFKLQINERICQNSSLGKCLTYNK